MKIINEGSVKVNVTNLRLDCVAWIKDQFDKKFPTAKAVLGISGGKDSTVAAALCVDALGKDRVVGLILPNGEQHDKDMAYEVCEYLGIEHYEINIKDVTSAMYSKLSEHVEVSEQSRINMPARIRTAMIMYFAQSVNGIMINTCNLSEDLVGYSTLFGDDLGSLAPLKELTVTEIVAIGEDMLLPDKFTHKIPSDGLCGKTDEDNIGLKYADIDIMVRSIGFNSANIETINKIIEYDYDKFKDECLIVAYVFDKLIEYGDLGPDSFDDFKTLLRKYRANKFKTEIVKIPSFPVPYWADKYFQHLDKYSYNSYLGI